MRSTPPSQTNGVVSWRLTGKSILHLIDEGLFLWEEHEPVCGSVQGIKMERTRFLFIFSSPRLEVRRVSLQFLHFS